MTGAIQVGPRHESGEWMQHHNDNFLSKVMRVLTVRRNALKTTHPHHPFSSLIFLLQQEKSDDHGEIQVEKAGPRAARVIG